MDKKISIEEQVERQMAVEQANANLALEGLYPDEISNKNSQQWVNGEITIKELEEKTFTHIEELIKNHKSH